MQEIAILNRIERKIDFLIENYQNFFTESKLLKPRDVAELYKVPKSSIYTYNRFLLPNFGRKENKDDLKWTLEEVLNWNKRSVEERKKEFANLPLS